MPLPRLPQNPTDAETVATFRAAVGFLHHQTQRAVAGLCVNLAGTFNGAAQALRAAADAIEGVPAATGDGQSPPAADLFANAERALELVAGRLEWPELAGYIAELEYRRTGIRPARATAATDDTRASDSAARSDRRPRRYYIAELVPTVALIPWEFELDDRREAIDWFENRRRFHRLAFGVVPMVLVDRERNGGVLLRSEGDVSGFDPKLTIAP